MLEQNINLEPKAVEAARKAGRIAGTIFHYVERGVIGAQRLNPFACVSTINYWIVHDHQLGDHPPNTAFKNDTASPYDLEVHGEFKYDMPANGGPMPYLTGIVHDHTMCTPNKIGSLIRRG